MKTDPERAAKLNAAICGRSNAIVLYEDAKKHGTEEEIAQAKMQLDWWNEEHKKSMRESMWDRIAIGQNAIDLFERMYP